MKCAILDDYQQVAFKLADWSSMQKQMEIFSIQEHFKAEALIPRINDCEIVVIMRERTPFDSKMFDSLPKLKLLVTTGMRNASIDVVSAANHNVIVCGTEGDQAPTVELTWALILALARHIVPEHLAIQNNLWQHTIGMTLKGKRIGIIGLGKIGKQVSIIAKAFGMEVCAWSPNLTKERTDEMGVLFMDTKENLLETSDIVSVHLVLSEKTKGIIGKEELNKLKSSSLFINTSRAAIVDQEALLEILQEKRIAGVGLDVFDEEPLPLDSPWRKFPNLLLSTPHIGYVADTTYQKFFSQIVEDIQAWLSGSPIRTILQ